MISRRKILKGGAMAAAVAAVPFIRVRQAHAQTVPTFDYYISPSGDDNNSGTLTSPWSITALNSKQSTYAGKHIGIIGDVGGTQTPYQYGTVGGARTLLYTLYQAGSSTGNPVLAINGGPSAANPTYLASCNSSGVYTPRWAIIDASNGANLPTSGASMMGQSAYGSSDVSQFGNVTVDALTIRNFTFSALIFDNSAGIGNLIIKNCEIYNGQNIPSNNNPGAIWLDGASNAIITNNKIHDLQTDSSGSSHPWALLGFIQFNSFGTQVTNCTFYNCVAISNKDDWQQLEVSYCYLGFGTFGSGYNGALLGATVNNYLTGTGLTNNFHHNICIGPLDLDGESSGQQNKGQVNIYNNTFYGAYNSAKKMDAIFCNLGNSGGHWAFYNNLVYSPYGYDGIANSNMPGTMYITTINSNPSWFTQCDYNAYGAGMTFGYGWNSGQYALPMSTWKGYGLDAHSILLSSNPFTGAPSEANSSSFAITGPATTAGVGGAVCGALDGTGPIGCNFSGATVLVPNAPSLKVS